MAKNRRGKKGGSQKRGTLSQHFKKGKKQKILPPTNDISADELSAYKREMSRLVTYANDQIDQAIAENRRSTELIRFLDGDDSKRFSISQLTDPSDIKATMTELRTVISTIEEGSRKGEVDSAIMEAEVWRHQFGNQHRSSYTENDGSVHYRRFNTNDVFDERGNIIRRAVDPQLASKTFAAYRRLEEDLAGYIGRQGQEMMFGSENLIILLYDFYEKNPGADYNFETDHDTFDAYDYARPLIEQWALDRVREMEGINMSFLEAEKIIADWDRYINRRGF